MKATYIILAGALALCTACSKEKDRPVEAAVPVTLTARIADETKATLSESDGTFAFSNTDVIKVYIGTGVYASTGVTISGDDATFTMAEGFTDTGSGFAAFPAGIVNNIYKEEEVVKVSLTLPTTYTYSQVGGLDPGTSPDASLAMVPCPMIASYTAGSDLEFKQAGAVVRFRITECVAGDITFTFTSKVTGTVILTAVPSGDDGGILATNLTNAGYSITVTGVPAVTTGNYIFITLPVPTGTDPMNVGIWNKGTSMNKVATLRNATPGSLTRAGGWKRSVTLADVKDAATFDGKILAGDLYYTGSYVYAIMEDPLDVLKYYSVNNTTSDNENSNNPIFYFSWDFFKDHGASFEIGGKNYYVPSSGDSGEWHGIVGTTRGGAKVMGNVAHYAFLTVTDVNSSIYHTGNNTGTIGGLLLFPDNAIIAVPSGAKLDTFDAADGDTYNVTTNNNTISLDGFKDLLNQGCSFFPTAGFWNSSTWYKFYWGRGWYGIDEVGTYWSQTSLDDSKAYALTVLRNHSTNSVPNLIAPAAHDDKSGIFYPVRLIRVPPAAP